MYKLAQYVAVLGKHTFGITKNFTFFIVHWYYRTVPALQCGGVKVTLTKAPYTQYAYYKKEL